MIWGCQYDAMLKWVLEGNDKNKLTENNNGNHSGYISNTGSYKNDCINNIYDLEGNLIEWTLEVANNYQRTKRGCDYITNNYNPTIRSSTNRTITNSESYGSRMTLYIK